MIKEKKVICFGEVLWDNLQDGRRIGGAPLNVCYHLSKYGIDGKIISMVGEDENGKEIIKELNRLGIDQQFCLKTPVYPTSTVEVHVLANTKVEYEIVDGVAWDHIGFTEEMAEAINTSAAFVYGSLSARNEVTRESLFKCISEANWAICDINLRSPFYNQALIEELLSHCQTLKINDDELNVLTRWFDDESADEEKNIATLFSRFISLNEVILTKGAYGASYYSRQETIHMSGIKIDVGDTVGSGDSFLAAFIALKLQGYPLARCMREAIALSAFVATFSGACPAYEIQDVINFKAPHHFG